MEIEDKRKLPFLDVHITRDAEFRIFQTAVYHKPTHTDHVRQESFVLYSSDLDTHFIPVGREGGGEWATVNCHPRASKPCLEGGGDVAIDLS